MTSLRAVIAVGVALGFSLLTHHLSAQAKPDEYPPVPDAVRKRAIEQHIADLEQRTKGHLDRIAHAKEKLKNPKQFGGVAAVRKQVTAAEEAYALFKKDPFYFSTPGTPPMFLRAGKVGAFGTFPEKNLPVAEAGFKGGTLVTYNRASAAEDRNSYVEGRFLVAGPVTIDKQLNTVRLSGYYAVVGVIKVNGENVPVVRAVDIQPEELPAKFRPPAVKPKNAAPKPEAPAKPTHTVSPPKDRPVPLAKNRTTLAAYLAASGPAATKLVSEGDVVLIKEALSVVVETVVDGIAYLRPTEGEHKGKLFVADEKSIKPMP